MNFRNVIWWLLFIFCGIWAQSFLRGVDVLMVGLVVSLQEDRLPQTLWLLGALVLIQEGAGSLTFGSSLLWYAMLIALYAMGRWLFQARNLLFMVLLGAGMGLWHYLLVVLMTPLQEYQVALDRLFFESFLQALVFPLAWALASGLRGKRERDAVSL